ncbi:MAG: YitT family protein [Bacteroidales bacterium]|nr:YitT family protein [Bacteroidales bacterium]MBD5209607.1 YitT family protein [Bacteroidales bacterium]MDE6083216.1 YitT family protein [Muribaculaceae bacterium]
MAKLKYDSMMNDVRDYVMITVGLMLYAIGFTAFILPHDIVIGGMAGLGTLVYFATNKFVPVAVTMYGVNIILMLSGFKVLGKAFLQRTIFGATGISIFIGAIEGYFTSVPPLIPDVTMSVVLGGILCGLGIGTIYIHNGTSGGSDIVAALVSKVSNASVGRTLMIVDMSIVGLTFFLPFDGDMQARVQSCVPRIIYGWVIIFIYSYITDLLINTNRQATQFIIFSSQWKEIADRINKDARRGVTVLDGQGWYSKHEVKILMVWCRKIESMSIFRIIKSVDPEAFISQGNVNGVYGKGFDIMKVKMKKEKKS